MKEIKPTSGEQIAALGGEIRELRAEIAKLWDAHLALQRRTAPAVLAHTRLGDGR